MTTFLIVTIGWIVSVCFHEFGHALTAWHGGDTTVRDKGYLTLNPLRYTHPFFSIILPVIFLFTGGIGLPGGAVYINDNLLRNRWWRTAVSLAGPASSLAVAVALCVPLWLGVMPADTNNVIACAFAFLIALEVNALILNLLPVPPLDGFQALSAWLPVRWAHAARQHGGLFLLIFFVLFWRVPQFSEGLSYVMFHALEALGIPLEMVGAGYRDFFFWRG
jgi:Zn-dependent protease